MDDNEKEVMQEQINMLSGNLHQAMMQMARMQVTIRKQAEKIEELKINQEDEEEFKHPK